MEWLDDSSAFPVAFTSQMSKTTFRPAGTEPIHFIIGILQEISVPRGLLTHLVALCEQMLDLSNAAPELIRGAEVEGRAPVLKQALQDQGPCAQGLQVGQLVTQSSRTREKVYIYYPCTASNLLLHIYFGCRVMKVCKRVNAGVRVIYANGR